MLEAFNEVLTAMAYAASGLAVFAIVWAGVVLMAEGAEARGVRKAPAAPSSWRWWGSSSSSRPRASPSPSSTALFPLSETPLLRAPPGRCLSYKRKVPYA